MKSRKIRNEAEYYLAQGVLASFSADATDEERVLLEELAAAYEAEGFKEK